MKKQEIDRDSKGESKSNTLARGARSERASERTLETATVLCAGAVYYDREGKWNLAVIRCNVAI